MPSGLNVNADKDYKPYLVRCMNLLNGTTQWKEYQFSNEELFALRPEGIARYFGKIAYGKENPDLQTDNPTHGRSSTLMYTKKIHLLFYAQQKYGVEWANGAR